MKPPPSGRDGPDQIFSLLDSALLEVLSEVQDPRLKVRARRLRISGVVSLALASLCIAAVAVLPSVNYAFGTLLLFGAAVVLLFCGGWLMDRASIAELLAHRVKFADALTGILRDAGPGVMHSKIRRRRYFGFGMLLLSGFCMSVVSAPLPGKQPLDLLMWAGFSVMLIGVGAWQLHQSSREALEAQRMSAAAHTREAAKTGAHIGRVK